MTRRPHPADKTARGYMRMVRQEPPRVKMECSSCEREVNRLLPVAVIDGKVVWVCDECRKGAK